MLTCCKLPSIAVFHTLHLAVFHTLHLAVRDEASCVKCNIDDIIISRDARCKLLYCCSLLRQQYPMIYTISRNQSPWHEHTMSHESCEGNVFRSVYMSMCYHDQGTTNRTAYFCLRHMSYRSSSKLSCHAFIVIRGESVQLCMTIYTGHLANGVVAHVHGKGNKGFAGCTT